jgi:hypothetical protein
MGLRLNTGKKDAPRPAVAYQVQPTSVAVSKPHARHHTSPDFPAIAGSPHCGHGTNGLPHGFEPMRFKFPTLVWIFVARRRGRGADLFTTNFDTRGGILLHPVFHQTLTDPP